MTVRLGLLSESTDGQGIAITAATSGSAQSIHSAITATTTASATIDKVYLFAQNRSGQKQGLWIHWGESTNAMKMPVPSQDGDYVVANGKPIANAGTVSAWFSNSQTSTGSGTGNVTLTGYILRGERADIIW